MPNWVFTSYEIEGPKEDMTKFLAGLGITPTDTDKVVKILETYYPVPQKLMDRTAGFYSKEALVDIQARNLKGEVSQEVVDQEAENLRLDDECMEEFGYKNWYEWQYDKWGTKWGDCNTEVDQCTERDGKYVISGRFETAWGPALDGFRKVSSDFPTLRFQFCYSEEADFFMGVEVLKNGELIFEDVFSPQDEFKVEAPDTGYDSPEWDEWRTKYDEFREDMLSKIEAEAEKAGR